MCMLFVVHCKNRVGRPSGASSGACEFWWWG